MMKPRRVCPSGGGMVTGPAAALVSGQENLTNTRIIYRSWLTRHQNFDISCRTTGLMDTARSHRHPVRSAAPGAPTDPPLRHPVRCCRCHRLCHRLCRYLILTGTLAREPVVSGSGATALWAVLGTGRCPTMDRACGTVGPGVVETPGCCPAVTGPGRCRVTENVSCPSLATKDCYNVVCQVSMVQSGFYHKQKLVLVHKYTCCVRK